MAPALQGNDRDDDAHTREEVDERLGRAVAVPEIVRTAYASLQVTEVARARWSWVDLLGFHVSDEDASTLYLRGSDALIHHNVVLRAGDVPCLGSLHVEHHRERGPDHDTLRWGVDDPRCRDFFGNEVVPSWYTEATPVSDLDGTVCAVEGILQEP